MRGLGREEPLTAQFLAQIFEKLDYMRCVVVTLQLGVGFVSLYHRKSPLYYNTTHESALSNCFV